LVIGWTWIGFGLVVHVASIPRMTLNSQLSTLNFSGPSRDS
jgi:hypothetical protein